MKDVLSWVNEREGGDLNAALCGRRRGRGTVEDVVEVEVCEYWEYVDARDVVLAEAETEIDESLRDLGIETPCGLEAACGCEDEVVMAVEVEEAREFEVVFEADESVRALGI